MRRRNFLNRRSVKTARPWFLCWILYARLKIRMVLMTPRIISTVMRESSMSAFMLRDPSAHIYFTSNYLLGRYICLYH
jgi:hypothetical protein